MRRAAFVPAKFAYPNFPPPQVSVYEEQQHPWAFAAGELPLEHLFQPQRGMMSGVGGFEAMPFR